MLQILLKKKKLLHSNRTTISTQMIMVGLKIKGREKCSFKHIRVAEYIENQSKNYKLFLRFRRMRLFFDLHCWLVVCNHQMQLQDCNRVFTLCKFGARLIIPNSVS